MKEKDEPEQRDLLLNLEDNGDKEKIQNTKKNKSIIEMIYNDHQNISFGLSFLGRIIMTAYSFHGLFLFYNLILEYFLLIPGFFFRINDETGKFLLSIIYICYSLCLSNILIIPTYEFLTFPYLMYPNSLMHLISFIYIYKEKEFNHKQIIQENKNTTFILNIIFYIIEGTYVIGYGLSMFTDVIIVKDLIKSIILILVYLNFAVLFMNYVFLSFYLMIRILFHKE